MKLSSSFLTAGLLASAFVAAAGAQDIKFAVPGQTDSAPAPAPAAAPAVAAAPSGFTDTQLTEEVGWFLAKKFNLSEMGFTPAQVDGLVRGLVAGTSGKDAPYDAQQIGPQMEAFMNARNTAYIGRLKEQATAQATAFFASLDGKPNVVKTASGLRYEIVKAGDGAYPKPTDIVTVNYTGTLVDGTVFDTSLRPREPGGTAAPADLDLAHVIPGWTEGMQKINKGGTIKLYVPAALAYGDDGQQGIPPGATLVFTVDLLDIKPAGSLPAQK